MAGIIGDVLRGQHDYMDAALRDNNMWIRRIALLHQLSWRDKTDTARLFEYCLTLAHEKEFTHKQKERLAPLSFREANKHL
jgi:3-methyladenine DNA glycosylase AlkD